MVQIEHIAEAALNGDSLKTRSLVQDFFQAGPQLSQIAPPDTDDNQLLAACAALLELFALRLKQTAPAWTTTIGPVSEPVYLLKSAATMTELLPY